MIQKSLASVPEALEEHFGASIVQRTSRLQSFHDLGPADLCSIQKILAQSKTEVPTFLYFTGVDTSSSASIAAHLQALASLIAAKSQYWFGEKKHWKVPELAYCTYNAFSRVDMRVTVHIPGQFETQIVASDGRLVQDQVSAAKTERLWLETFVLAMVRCLLDSDEDESNKVGGLVEIRRENPFGNGTASRRLLATFVAAFETLFWDGPKLGCGIDVPQPSLTNNYLVEGFLRCVQLTQHYDAALETLARLQQREPAVVSLVARVLLMKDEEIRAVQTMHAGIAHDSRDAELLYQEAQFLVAKKRYDLALHLARQAVQLAPSDFKTWALLVQVYTKLNDFEAALLTLNSCPMNLNRENFQIRRHVTLRGRSDDLHLPFPVDVTLAEVTNLHSAAIAAEQKNLELLLQNLPAGQLKSTFAQAYGLLTEIALKIGWEALLRHRTKVFVMEEEYRKDRGTARGAEGAEGAEKEAESAEKEAESAEKEAESAEKEAEKETAPGNDNDSGVRGSSETAPALVLPDDASTVAIKSPIKDVADSTGAAEAAEAAAQTLEASRDAELRKKRLCERWLDNLFMLLYEDLRVYTMWQAESVHAQAQQIEYKKSTLEWEILGTVAFRLKHFKEGAVAFGNALHGRFLAKSQREMLKYYQLERTKLVSKTNVADAARGSAQALTRTINQLDEKILAGAIKMLVWNHRWYNDFSPNLIQTFTDLLATEGLIKIQSIVQAFYSGETNHPDGSASLGIIDMMEGLYDFAKEYKLQGVEN